MRARLILLCCSTLVYLGALPSAWATPIEQQRLLYDQAKQALAKGDPSRYYQSRAALQGYPLEAYLAYEDLSIRLDNASTAEVSQFFAQHGDLPQARWLKVRWLKLLADREDWNEFIHQYDPKLKLTEQDCLHGRYLLAQGHQAEGLAEAEQLWLVGKSQPTVCEPLFSRWIASGALTESKLWQRAKLATEAGNSGLASQLVQQMTRLQQAGQLMLDVAQKPQLLISQADRFQGNQEMGDVVGTGLRRLAKQDPEQALSLLERYSARVSFTPEERVAVARIIGLSLAKRFDGRALGVMATYDPELRDATLTEWRARLLLRLGRWHEAYELTKRLPKDLANTNRWRYWQARSFELANPTSDQIATLYQPIAQERDFYGFLAADRIHVPYQLKNQPLPLSPELVQKVRDSDIMRRIMELQARGQLNDARREWYHTSNLFSRDELVAQARLGYDMGWYFPAIRTISQAQYWDDLDIRFPMAHGGNMLQAAQVREIHPSWVFAITRQESAFMSDARSSVGAGGLMQLMPATAQETAQRYGILLSSPQQVFEPETNIQLGAAYLSQIYGQFNGSRVLASAAYNAGPGRVRQWLKDARHLSFDVWIENIPFDETRQYVQNVLTYSVIYGKKLDKPQPLVDWHERFFDEP